MLIWRLLTAACAWLHPGKLMEMIDDCFGGREGVTPRLARAEEPGIGWMIKPKTQVLKAPAATVHVRSGKATLFRGPALA